MGALMVRRDQKHLHWLLLASICAAPFLVSLPLTGRNMRTQGIAAFPIYSMNCRRPIPTHLFTRFLTIFSSLRRLQLRPRAQRSMIASETHPYRGKSPPWFYDRVGIVPASNKRSYSVQRRLVTFSAADFSPG